MSLLDDDLIDRLDKDILVLSLRNISDEDIPAWIQAWYDTFMDMIVKKQETGRTIYKLLTLYEACLLNKSYRTYRSKYEMRNVVYTMYIPDRQLYVDEWKKFSQSYLDDILINEINSMYIDIRDMMIGLFGVFDCDNLQNSEFVSNYIIAHQHSYNNTEFIKVNSKYEYYKGLIESLYLSK